MKAFFQRKPSLDRTPFSIQVTVSPQHDKPGHGTLFISHLASPSTYFFYSRRKRSGIVLN
jgi:hypothetical protein